MKYIKLFDTTAEYTAYTADTANFITPNVSVCKDAPTETHFHPYVDPYNGHDYVEIGGLKWATMNIGASSVTDAGKYFQWGDISGYTAAQVGSDKVFNWANYKYCDGTSSNMTKYNSTDGKTVLDSSDDAAQAAWGGSWRMPTKAEFQALGNAVNTAWTSNYNSTGVKGLVLTDKDDSSKVLFFPAAGNCYDGSVDSVGNNGGYWSSSLFDDFVAGACRLYFNGGDVYWDSDNGRYCGYPVRGVVG